MAIAVEVKAVEMKDFLVPQGFQEVQVPGTKERVYSKVVDKSRQVCLRVYTSIVGESSRGVGEDAIRTVLVAKVNGEVKVIGGDRRVHRVEGWRANLQNRLDGWPEQFGPACPKCQGLTVRRRSARGPFWGCCKYPICKSVQPISTPTVSRPTKRTFGHSVKFHQDEFDQHQETERNMSESMAASENAWLDRMEEKAAFAKLEREQEAKAYMREMEDELRAAGVYDEDDEPAPAVQPVPAGDPPPANW